MIASPILSRADSQMSHRISLTHAKYADSTGPNAHLYTVACEHAMLTSHSASYAALTKPLTMTLMLHLSAQHDRLLGHHAFQNLLNEGFFCCLLDIVLDACDGTSQRLSTEHQHHTVSHFTQSPGAAIASQHFLQL